MSKTYKATYSFDDASQLYIGENTEVEGAVNEGSSLEELKSNLIKATQLCLQMNGEDPGDFDIELVEK